MKQISNFLMFFWGLLPYTPVDNANISDKHTAFIFRPENGWGQYVAPYTYKFTWHQNPHHHHHHPHHPENLKYHKTLFSL
jgi:hypothetical protein